MKKLILFKSLSVIGLLVLIAGCCSKGGKENRPLILSIEPREAGTLFLSEIFDSVELIPLPSVMGRPEKLEIHGYRVYLSAGNTLYIYDSLQSIPHEIDRRGHGHGEYTQITDYNVDEDGSFWINDLQSRKMFHYDVEGHFLSQIDHSLLSYNFLKREDAVYINSGYLYNPEHPWQVSIWDESSKSLVSGYFKQSQGQSWLSVLEKTNFACFCDTVSYSHSFSNDIYWLCEGSAVPRVHISFGKSDMPEGYASRFHELRPFIESLTQSDYAWRIDGYREDEDYLFFGYSFRESHPYVVYRKSTGSIRHFSSFVDDLLFPGVKRNTDYSSFPIGKSGTDVFFVMSVWDFKDNMERSMRAGSPDPGLKEQWHSLDELPEGADYVLLKYRF